MADQVESSKTLKSISRTEEDPSHQTNKEPLCCEPPPKSCLSIPYSASPLSDQTFLQAAVIFQQLREDKPVTQRLQYGEKTDTPLPLKGDKVTEMTAFQLAFSTLKYQDVLEYMITDSCFHTSQHIPGNLLPLAMVMLCDLQERMFLLQHCTTKDGQECHQEVRDLHNSLQRYKTKLAASLARFRVKESLRSVSSYLVESVRTKQRQAKCLPLYGWVNTLKYSIEEVCEALQSTSLCEVENMTELKEMTFCRDPLCSDTLVFSTQLHAWLQQSSLSLTHTINIQERALCVAVNVLRPLLFDGCAVLVAGSFSAISVAQVAVAASARSGRVLICGADHTPSQIEEIKELLTEMDLKNFRILSESFFELDEWDNNVQHLKVILVLPQCSSSALNDPVPIMHSEHGDWELLTDLSHGLVSKSKIHTMMRQQALLLGHALSFSRVQTVVYCTRSVYPEENEQLVKRVLEKTRTHPKLLPFRVNGPIFPDNSQSGDTAESKYFSLRPSSFTNGCFIARLSRQADPTKVETVQDVLARAAAKGLLGGILPEQSKPSKKGKGKKSQQATSKPSSASNHNGQEKESKGNAEDEEDKEEEDEEERENGKGSKGGKKNKVVKGRKGKAHSKQTVTKKESKGSKKKVKKKKVSHHNKRKSRRIPRLTLSLMSSAKASARLSLITPLVKKLKDNPAIITSSKTSSGSSTPDRKQPISACPAPPSLPATPQQLHQKTTVNEKEKVTETESISEAQGKLELDNDNVEAYEDVKPVDFMLLHDSPTSCGSISSKSDTSLIAQDLQPD